MNKLIALVVVLIFGAVLLSPFVVNVINVNMNKGMSKLDLVLPTSGKCVKDTEYMRANHMDLLEKARVKAVRDGERSKDYSLKNCQSCHERRDEFCDRCHNFVGVKPECFECHYFPTGKEECKEGN
ncbi:MAG: cytochrome C [bacterium]